MAFWNRTKDLPREREEVGGAPLDPTALLELVERIGDECAQEVGRLGGDADQVMATVHLDTVQRVTRVELVSDGMPLLTGKTFIRQLNDLAAPLVNQPPGRRLAHIDATVADGQLQTRITYAD
ncbi:hypothetical protein PZ938_11090 [Luteipulveratus sp. YIM 133132]|uniref:hypothetical protein n=1 Tax=Luteipulveratus flavus TaxID=3031728 RepID=UPI0023AE8968|nr:hypothetical protein [Luteipulveratus sp. YIM 133132]MDE9366151.1 hypothetical protein [Luteipulveratus sp. YIM 133132]